MDNNYVWIFAGIGLITLSALVLKQKLGVKVEKIDSSPLD